MERVLKSVSIIIPTFNRSEDLKKTMKQLVEIVDEKTELIVVDQSNIEILSDYIVELKTLCVRSNVRYYHLNEPSIPLLVIMVPGAFSSIVFFNRTGTLYFCAGTIVEG